MIVTRAVQMIQRVNVDEESSHPINLVAIAKAFTNEEDWEVVNEKIEVKEQKDEAPDEWLRNLK